MPSPGSRRVLRRVLVAVAVLLVALGGTVAFLLLHAPGNVSHPDLSFTVPPPTATDAPPAPPHKKKTPVVDNFAWPRYGFDAARTRFFPGGSKLNPPLKVGWRFQDYALLEFPPVIYQNNLYLLDDDGSAKELNKLNGHKIWERKIGTVAAASPAIGEKQGLVYFSVLSTNHGAGSTPGNGRFVALSMKTGKIKWSLNVPAGTESSPLAWGNDVYFGDQSGTVYSLNATTGHVNWTYHASGAVKGGVAWSDGIVYFGDYAGRAYALNANNGHQVWAVSTSGTAFGFGSGNFYSTPAVAFGRVYMGNTDGRVYSFAAKTGQLAWATGTGAYVYASAAVDDVPGLGPTVYLGSYDGNFYAFNAQSGSIRWTHPAGGKISGSATIVGNVVYYSDLGTRTTAGLNLRTGKQVFSFPDGAFNPVIADPGAIYLSGYTMLYQMLPKRATHHRIAPRSKSQSNQPAPTPPITAAAGSQAHTA
jgi:outer membrane protein assembly factor BamB